ncbi:hypothetical protein SAMN05421676_102454 [Salinibacillus kushneri]|uniref:Uncharacterized protein n=1 Tax=Salinibacillus kushneri TaxID=237682 RepID=A0A1I0BH20_9BACI|nr:hypothetical protein [Salinibacillus kushneri]SET05499.1 hypothetical protein SAMN05421676_102454 [Salinibacillus kushneri]
MRKEKRKKEEPTIAPGMDTEDELKEEATKKEVEEGDYTNVTTVSWDENDPS